MTDTESHRLAPLPNLPSPVTTDAMERYLECNLPSGWHVEKVRFTGTTTTSITRGPVVITVVKTSSLPDERSYSELMGDEESMADLQALRDVVAISCNPVNSTGHPDGAKSHKKVHPKTFSHHCITASLPSNRGETVLDEQDTVDALDERDLLMAIVNGAHRYEATGRAAPAEAPASEQSGTDSDENQLTLGELES